MTSDTTPTLGMDDSSRVWDHLAARIESLVEQWEAGGDPPELAELLRPEDPPNLRRLALVELIKVDLEYRWQRRNLPRLVEEYAMEFAELAGPDGLPSDLIYEEFHVRRRAGESLTAQDYYERFPDRADELKRLFAFESPEVTTSVFAGGGRKPPAQVGEQIDDFDLLAQLGSGAFATVFLARQNSVQRLVALKVSADKGTEIQTLAQLDHPHIVRVYDQRVVPERRIRLMYMQYVPGGTLQAVVERVRKAPQAERSGKLLLQAVDAALDGRGESPPADSATRARLRRSSWPEAVCWLGTRLASALAYAHRQGVLHRDVKPANVLVAADATPKLVDFNISFSSKLEGATPAAYFGGSLAYMSPEQLEACNPAHQREPAELDRRSDVYSLGIMLWELLTGERPFSDEAVDIGWSRTLEAMTAKRRAGVPAERVARLPRDLPPGLAQVLLECLEPEVERRMTSADELRRQLLLCLQPRAQRLLRPARMGLGALIRWAPITAWAVAGLLPNLLASSLNISYNVEAILHAKDSAGNERFPQPVRDYFWHTVFPAVNSIAYPIGLGIGVLLAWPVVRAIHRIRNQTFHRDDLLPAIRQRCLLLGDFVSCTVFGLWLSSGLGIPLTLRYGPSVAVPFETGDYLQFGASQLLFGMVAATLCYFLMTAVGVRALYPLLIKPDTQVPEDAEALARLGRRSWIYFGFSIAVPFIAVGLLPMSESLLQTAFRIVGALGLASVALVFWLMRIIQGDVAALALAVQPARDDAVAGDEADSFWTRSR